MLSYFAETRKECAEVFLGNYAGENAADSTIRRSVCRDVDMVSRTDVTEAGSDPPLQTNLS